MPDPAAHRCPPGMPAVDSRDDHLATLGFEGGMRLCVDYRRRSIRLELPAESSKGGGGDLADAMQWTVFRCISSRALAPRFWWEFVAREPHVFTSVEWQQVRQVRRALFAELPVYLRRCIVRMRFPWLTFHDIERMWGALDSVRCLTEVNVRLLPLWLCFPVRNSDTWGRDAALQLKSALHDRYGFPPATWRTLCRHGWRVFPTSEMRGCVAMRCMHARAYVRLIGMDRICTMRTEEKILLWRLAKQLPGILCDGGDLARALLRHVRQEFAAGRCIDDIGVEQMLDALCWFHVVPERFRPDANQKRAGWRWWLRQMHMIEAQPGLPACEATWTCPVDTFAMDEFTVVPLRSADALRKEGGRMRNCLAGTADTFARRCMGQELRIYSIRYRGQDGPSLGTVSLSIGSDGQPHLREARGIGNKALAESLEPVARELLRRYRQHLLAHEGAGRAV